MINGVGNSKDQLTIHGTLVRTRDEGILFVGNPGSGKSSAALKHLLSGDSLVADDVVIIKRRDGKIFGTAPETLKGVIAIRDLGIFDVRDVLGVGFFSESTPIDRGVEIGLTGDAQPREIEFFGIKIPLSFEETQAEIGVHEVSRTIDREAVKRSEARISTAHDALVSSAS